MLKFLFNIFTWWRKIFNIVKKKYLNIEYLIQRNVTLNSHTLLTIEYRDTFGEKKQDDKT